MTVPKAFIYMLKKTNYSTLVFLVLYFFTCVLNAQTAEIESLLTQLRSVRPDSSKAALYNELSWEFNRIDSTEIALAYADAAIKLSKIINIKSELATGYVRYGDVLSDRGKKKASIPYYDSALLLEKARGYNYGIGRASNQLAGVYRVLGHWEKSKENAHRAIKKFTQEEQYSPMTTASIILANTLMDLGEYDSSIYYLNRSLEYYKEKEDQTKVADTYLNLSSLHIRMNSFTRAIRYGEKSLEIYTRDTLEKGMAQALNNLAMTHYELGELTLAERYSRQSLMLKKKNNMYSDMASSYNTLGNIASGQMRLDSAKIHHTKALSIRKKFNQAKLFISHINLGNIARYENLHELALKYYGSAYASIDSLGVVDSYSEVLSWLSVTYGRLKQPEKSILFSSKYRESQNRIKATLNKVNNLERELEKKQYQLKLVEKENERQQVITLSLIGGIILLILLFFTILRISQLRKRNLITKQNELLQKQEIEKLIKEKEIEAINAMVEGQESERLRIARDLHDRLGGTLSIVKMHFKSVEQSIEELKDKSVLQYKEANNLLDEACDEVRKIAHDMTSGVLMKFGLVAALESLKETVEKADELKMNLIDIGLEERLSYEYEINIYRIIQELLTNTLKHANAKEMNIQLFRKEERINIVVDDDGIGFLPEPESSPKGMGLKSIESRVYKFNGEINIDSGKGAGTTITIDMPIKNDRP